MEILNKIIAIIGLVAFMKPVHSASIANSLCLCSREYIPVCASDDLTYPNQCLFECEKERNSSLQFRFSGECSDKFRPFAMEDDFCACAKDFNPVCGSDDETYPNECWLNCQMLKRKDLKLKHIGQCECACSRVYFPLCGSDDNTYSNECAFNCAKKINRNLAVKFEGECSEVHILPIMPECICPEMYEPLCATDGNTYSNECQLRCEQGRRSGLKFKHFGACDDA